MQQTLVMTLIGRDRPGLVEALAAIIEEHGGNWEESRMVQLAGGRIEAVVASALVPVVGHFIVMLMQMTIATPFLQGGIAGTA
ncbi:MAG: ACT domain-containing protein, partial [Thermoanaerobaculia bacterium]